jgi:hypothetical protein
MAAPAVIFGYFNHPAMLGWLLAAAAPLIIHLLNRRRHREMEWAAMRFLLAAVRKHSRRIRIEQWLLLAVRMLIVVLVALAVADPYLTRAGLQFVSGQRTHKVLVIDASYSMAYGPADKNRFDRAKEMAARIIEESGQGDGFTLVLLAAPPRVVVGTPAFERHDVLAEIDNLKRFDGGADLPTTLTKVEEIIETARREYPRLVRSEVYLLSDLGRNTWVPEFRGDSSQLEAALADFRRRAQRLAAQATLVVADLGEEGADNLAVTALRAVEPYATSARPVTLEAELCNFGRQNLERQVVELYVDGRRAGESRIDVPAGDTAAATFSQRFDTPGEHAIEVRSPGDLLAVDNHRWLSLPVAHHLRVLCVNGKPSGGDFQGATDYLLVALSPHGPTDERSVVRAEVVAENALAEADLRDYDCVFLANVGQFTADEARTLSAYVKGGGGLVFFLGDQVNADNYNRQLADGREGVDLLPARLIGPAPLDRDRPYLFDPLDYEHSIVAPFRGRDRAGLLTTRIYEYMRATVPEPETDGAAAQVALAFTNGDPAIVEKRVGRGRTVLVTTAADPSWSAWPMWPSYVPIVQEIVAEAVRSRTSQRNLVVGQSLGGETRAPADAEATIERPSGEREPLRLAAEADHARWTYRKVDRAGIYRVEFGAPLGRDEFFAANVLTAEGNMAKISLDELRDDVWPGVAFEPFGGQSSTETPTAPIARRDSLHHWLLLAALALVLTETALACWLGRRAA